MITVAEHLRTKGYTSWPSLLAWFTLILVLFQVAALPSAYGRSDAETFVRLVYAIASVVSAVLIIVTATRLQGRRKVSAIFAALGFSGGALAYLYQFAAYLTLNPAQSWITELLYSLLYILSIIAISIYFKWDWLWLGSVLRVLSDSIVVGFSLYIILYDALPRTHLAWAIHLNGYITFDMAVVFALCVVVIRYGKNGGPIIVFIVLAVICLIIGDLVYTYFNYFSGFKSSVPSMPLYAIDGILVGIAHYRSIYYPPRESGGLTEVRSTSEWFAWYFMPLQLLLLAFAKISSIDGPNKQGNIVALLLLGFIHQVVAVMDYRRVFNNLRFAQLEAVQANADLLRANQELQRRQQIEADLAAERARTTMARDIHDTVGGHLHAASMLASGLMHVESMSPSVQRMLRLLHTSVLQADQEMRRAITVLNSTQDAPEFLLEKALAAPVVNAQQYGLPVTLSVLGTPRPILAAAASELVHVTQEALTNVRKHAEATDVRITVDYTDPAGLILIIADNGVGMPASATSPRADSTGNGLGNMRARVEALRGQFALPLVEQGVTLWMKFPL